MKGYNFDVDGFSPYIFLVLGILLIGTGVYGIIRFIQGKGAHFHHYPWYQKTLQNLPPNLHWWSRYVLWSNNLFFVGTKAHASRFERFYLIVGSVTQLVTGLVMLWAFYHLLSLDPK